MIQGSHTNSSQMSSSGQAGKTSGTGSDASGSACASIALAAETRAFALAEIAPTPCNLSIWEMWTSKHLKKSANGGQAQKNMIPSIPIVGFQCKKLLGKEWWQIWQEAIRQQGDMSIFGHPINTMRWQLMTSLGSSLSNIEQSYITHRHISSYLKSSVPRLPCHAEIILQISSISKSNRINILWNRIITQKKKTFHIKRTFAAQLQFLCIQPIRQQTSPLYASNSQSMMSKRLANFGKQDVKGRLEDCENRASVSQEDLLQTSVCVFSTSLYDRLEVSHTNNQTYNINMQWTKMNQIHRINHTLIL